MMRGQQMATDAEDKRNADDIRARITNLLNETVAIINEANIKGLQVTFNIGGVSGKQTLEFLKITKSVEL